MGYIFFKDRSIRPVISGALFLKFLNEKRTLIHPNDLLMTTQG